ncbi:MAG: tRNA (N6-isopentenyl adenosine(37)-C2)-methylthiotransferase MiaB [Candidatus Peregrinibacteria bacterium]
MQTYFLKTFGCAMNAADSERAETILESIGMRKTEAMEEADLVLFNTCSIKQHAEDRVHGFVHNAKKMGKIVGITGCMVKTSSTQFSEIKDPLLKQHKKIDLVFRIEDLVLLPDLLKSFDENISQPEIPFAELDYLNITPKRTEKFRAFVPIMTGCDKFCTYCIVPYTRGRERSRPLQDILTECERHIAEGALELTLVGQNVNAYFLDDSTRIPLQRKTDFATLLEQVAQIPGLKRLKFTSPHPRHMGDDVLEVMAKYPNIAKTIHLPVQSGSSKILRAMGREHRIDAFKKITAKARELMPDITITTDIIVGFCGETEEDFQKTVKLFHEEQFLIAYISKYSPRKGTFAADRMEDDVSNDEKKRRYDVLNEKLKETSLSQNQHAVGQVEEVLVEEIENGIARGKTHTGRTCAFPGKEKSMIGKIVSVKITAADTWSVMGEML